MARLIVDDSALTGIEKLDPAHMREVTRKCVLAGAKVIEKEMKNTIEARGHIVNRYMLNSVGPGVLHEDIDRTWIEVYPQGDDPRGVQNEMKYEMLVKGYYNRDTGRKIRRDPVLKNIKAKAEPKVLAAMAYQFDLCMKEINGG